LRKFYCSVKTDNINTHSSASGQEHVPSVHSFNLFLKARAIRLQINILHQILDSISHCHAADFNRTMVTYTSKVSKKQQSVPPLLQPKGQHQDRVFKIEVIIYTSISVPGKVYGHTCSFQRVPPTFPIIPLKKKTTKRTLCKALPKFYINLEDLGKNKNQSGISLKAWKTPMDTGLTLCSVFRIEWKPYHTSEHTLGK